jgi:CheY-like chemotaxis protein
MALNTGKEALARIEPASYHLVLMNLVMPVGPESQIIVATSCDSI